MIKGIGALIVELEFLFLFDEIFLLYSLDVLHNLLYIK